jgi:TP901 family phage tail tape measure protein
MAASQVLQTLVVRLTLNASNYTTGLHTALNRARTFGQQMSTVGVFLTRSVTLPLTVMGGVAVNEFGKFDKAMTKSLSIMSGVTKDMRRQMEDQAKLLGSTTVTSADRAADAYYDLAQSGMNAADAMAALPITNKFAIAGMFDMSKATDILTDAQAALGMAIHDNAAANAANMKYLSDILVKGSTQANTTVEQLSTALTTKAAAAMRFFRIEVEQGVAVLSAYSDMGKKGAEAGNLYDRALRLLAETVQKNKSVHDQFGFSVYDATGNMRNMADIVDNLDQLLAGLGAEQRAATLSLLGFQARSQQAITPLLGMGAAIRRYEEGLRTANGYTEQVVDKVQSGFIAQMTIMWNKTKVVAAEIGERLVPIIKLLSSSLDAMLIAWNSIPGPIQHVVTWLGVAAAVAGPYILAMSTLSMALRNVAASLRIVGVLGTQQQTMWMLMRASAAGLAGVIGGALLVTLKGVYDQWVGLNAAMEESQRLQAMWMTASQLGMNNQIKGLMEIADAQERANEARRMGGAENQNLLAAETELKRYRDILKEMDKDKFDVTKDLNKLITPEGDLWERGDLLAKLKEAEELYKRQMDHVKKIAEIEKDALRNKDQMVENMRTQLAAMGVPQDKIAKMTPKEIKKMLSDKEKMKEEGPSTFWSGINNYLLQGRQMIHTAQQTMLGFAAEMGFAVEDEMAAIQKAEDARLKKAQKEAERAEKDAARAEDRLKKEIEKNKLGDALGLKTKGLGAMIDAFNPLKNKELFSAIARKPDDRGRPGSLSEAEVNERAAAADAKELGARKKYERVIWDANSTEAEKEAAKRTFNAAHESADGWRKKKENFLNNMPDSDKFWEKEEWWNSGKGHYSRENQWLTDEEKFTPEGEAHFGDQTSVDTVTETQGERMISALEKIANQPKTTITFVDANLV